MIQGFHHRSTPVISVIGRSGAGKTRVIESLVSILTSWGWRIATVKHSNKSPNLDIEGKDTWKHRRAGAKEVLFVSPGELFLFKELDGTLNMQEIKDRYLPDVDLIIVEGWHENAYPKIVVCPEGKRENFLKDSVDHIWAVVGSEHPAVSTEVPFYTMADIVGLALSIEREFLIRSCKG